MTKNQTKKKNTEVKDNQLLAQKKDSAATGTEDNLVEQISEDFDRFETWAIANGKYILTVCILVVIGVAIFFTTKTITNNRRSAATMRLNQAETEADLVKVLKETSTEIPGYDTAQIRLARRYAAGKKYDKAFEQYRAVATRKNDLYISCRAALDSGYIRELEGKPAEAVKIFADIADSKENIMIDLRAEAAYAAGRLYVQLNKKDEARKYLSMLDPAKLPREMSSAPWFAMRARALLNRLPAEKKAVPAKKNAAAVKAVPAKTTTTAVKKTIKAAKKK